MPPEMDAIVEKNIDDFSAYVQDCLEKDFMDQEKINEKIMDHKNAIKELKKLKIQTKSTSTSTKDEQKYLKQMKEHSKMYGIEDALLNYNKKFEKKITIQKFKELIGE